MALSKKRKFSEPNLLYNLSQDVFNNTFSYISLKEFINIMILSKDFYKIIKSYLINLKIKLIISPTNFILKCYIKDDFITIIANANSNCNSGIFNLFSLESKPSDRKLLTINTKFNINQLELHVISSNYDIICNNKNIKKIVLNKVNTDLSFINNLNLTSLVKEKRCCDNYDCIKNKINSGLVPEYKKLFSINSVNSQLYPHEENECLTCSICKFGDYCSDKCIPKNHNSYCLKKKEILNYDIQYDLNYDVIKEYSISYRDNQNLILQKLNKTIITSLIFNYVKLSNNLIFVTFDKLQKLDLSYSDLKDDQLNLFEFKLLEEINLFNCNKLSDNAIVNFVEKHRKLKVINMATKWNIYIGTSIDILQNIISLLPNLKYLACVLNHDTILPDNFFKNTLIYRIPQPFPDHVNNNIIGMYNRMTNFFQTLPLGITFHTSSYSISGILYELKLVPSNKLKEIDIIRILRDNHVNNIHVSFINFCKNNIYLADNFNVIDYDIIKDINIDKLIAKLQDYNINNLLYQFIIDNFTRSIIIKIKKINSLIEESINQINKYDFTFKNNLANIYDDNINIIYNKLKDQEILLRYSINKYSEVIILAERRVLLLTNINAPVANITHAKQRLEFYNNNLLDCNNYLKKISELYQLVHKYYNHYNYSSIEYFLKNKLEEYDFLKTLKIKKYKKYLNELIIQIPLTDIFELSNLYSDFKLKHNKIIKYINYKINKVFNLWIFNPEEDYEEALPIDFHVGQNLYKQYIICTNNYNKIEKNKTYIKLKEEYIDSMSQDL